MMGEIVARNMWSKAIAENKNAIVASCWTYFTTTVITYHLVRLEAGGVNSTRNLLSGSKYIQYENLHDLVI